MLTSHDPISSPRLGSVLPVVLSSILLVSSLSAQQSPVTVLHSFFAYTDSKQPINLIKGRDGNFYGETIGPGVPHDFGSIFRISPDGSFKTLHFFFDPAFGDAPIGRLVQGSDGNFYGTTVGGGRYYEGTAFRITPDGDFTILHEFGSFAYDGLFPYGGLVEGRDGNFYGGTPAGGRNGAGVLYRMTTTGEVTIVHDFAFNFSSQFPVPPAPGARTFTNLVQGRDGMFYGITNANSVICFDGICDVGDYGVVFRITENGNYKVLYRFPPGSFDSTSGYSPNTLMLAGDGNFYGTTVFGGGGQNPAGTIFQITPTGKITFLHSFHYVPRGGTGPRDGAFPSEPLLDGKDGYFYSTILECPSNDCMYRINSSGDFQVLYHFTQQEAESPNNLVWGDDGFIYADAQGGGLLQYVSDGDVFSFNLQLLVPVSTDGLSPEPLASNPSQLSAPRDNRLCQLPLSIYCRQ
jgi:uncharacterized repeat protein (TIGR03803 family)